MRRFSMYNTPVRWVYTGWWYTPALCPISVVPSTRSQRGAGAGWGHWSPPTLSGCYSRGISSWGESGRLPQGVPQHFVVSCDLQTLPPVLKEIITEYIHLSQYFSFPTPSFFLNFTFEKKRFPVFLILTYF